MSVLVTSGERTVVVVVVVVVTRLLALNGRMVVASYVVALGLDRGLGRELLAVERAHVVEVHLLGGVQLLVGIG